MKHPSLPAMRRDAPELTTWLAMLGPCAAVPHGKQMARLAAHCASVGQSLSPDAQGGKLRQAALSLQRRRVRLAKRWLAPRLAALLWDSLATLAPQPLENFAAIVRRIRAHNEARQPTHPFHEKALRLARVLAAKHTISPRVEWPVTRDKFLDLLGVPKREHDGMSYYRRELKRLRIRFAPDKRGRKKGTAKRRT